MDGVLVVLTVVFLAVGVLTLAQGAYLWAAICLCLSGGNGLAATATRKAWWNGPRWRRALATGLLWTGFVLLVAQIVIDFWM
jgi:hypothetical protein